LQNAAGKVQDTGRSTLQVCVVAPDAEVDGKANKASLIKTLIHNQDAFYMSQNEG
jgi:hypothetical protein